MKIWHPASLIFFKASTVGGDRPPELQLKRTQAQVLQFASTGGQEDSRGGRGEGSSGPILHFFYIG
jgi:hypothetical protein